MHRILIYLHTIHSLKSSTCFEHYPAHLQEVYVVIVYAASGIVTVCSSFLAGARDGPLQGVTILEAAYMYNYDVYLLKMSRVMLETCEGF
jgi:hypothetical protein